MSKKKSRSTRQNQFLIGALAGAVVTYVLINNRAPVLPRPGGNASTLPSSMLPDGALLGLPPQPLTIQRMSATYIP